MLEHGRELAGIGTKDLPGEFGHSEGPTPLAPMAGQRGKARSEEVEMQAGHQLECWLVEASTELTRKQRQVVTVHTVAETRWFRSLQGVVVSLRVCKQKSSRAQLSKQWISSVFSTI